jgi:hypothetical protein
MNFKDERQDKRDNACRQSQKETNTYDSKIQELWDMIKRINLRIHRIEDGAEI